MRCARTKQWRPMNDILSLTRQPQAFENRVLERLNSGRSVRCLLIAAVNMLAEAVDLLVGQVFRKDDYAVKYAVEPLLQGDGPLGELSVRLKLIYGLGVINRNEYEDCERLMALCEALNHDRHEYRFTDDKVAGPVSALHCVDTWPTCPNLSSHDSELRAMQQQRYQQVLRSTLVLSLTALISPLGLKQAFKK